MRESDKDVKLAGLDKNDTAHEIESVEEPQGASQEGERSDRSLPGEKVRTAPEELDEPAALAPSQEDPSSERPSATNKNAPQGEQRTGRDDDVDVVTFFRERYFTLDRRLLGLFRIYFGVLLLVDVLRRIPDAAFFYSTSGILPNHFALFAPMVRPFFSIYTAFSTTAEVRFAFLLTAVVFLCFIVGFKTRVAQVLAFVCITSLNTRNTFIENGGCVTMNLVACWSMFMPLGDRFSVDALIKSFRRRREHTPEGLNDRSLIDPDRRPFASIAVLAIVIQIAAIYLFNAAHKSGPTWKNGEAIHWVLWQNRIATHFAAWLRMHEAPWLSPLLTRMTLVVEGVAPLLVLFPFFQRYLRTLHVVLLCGLHISIALLMTLGPFSYVMVAINSLMLPAFWLDAAAERLNRNKPDQLVVYDANDRALHFVARLLARLDTEHHLRFASPESPEAENAPKAVIAIQDATSQRWALGTDAIICALRSLPLGRLLTLSFGSPPGKALLRMVLRRRKRWSRRLDLIDSYPSSPEVADAEVDRPVSPLGRQALRWRVRAREAVVFVFLLAAVLEISHDNSYVSRIAPWLRVSQQPKLLEPIILYPRLLQGWSMFSPDAPREDGTIVVDAITTDGRHIDPLRGLPPDFDAPLHGPWFNDQLWCDYLLKIHHDSNKGYRDQFKAYLTNWQQTEHRPANDRLRSFEVYWVNNNAPPPGQTEPFNIRRTLLFTGP